MFPVHKLLHSPTYGLAQQLEKWQAQSTLRNNDLLARVQRYIVAEGSGIPNADADVTEIEKSFHMRVKTALSVLQQQSTDHKNELQRIMQQQLTDRDDIIAQLQKQLAQQGTQLAEQQQQRQKQQCLLTQRESEIAQLQKQLAEVNSQLAQQKQKLQQKEQQQQQQQAAETTRLKSCAENLSLLSPTTKLWMRERPIAGAYVAELQGRVACMQSAYDKLHGEKNALQMQIKVYEQLLALQQSGGNDSPLVASVRKPAAASTLHQTTAVKPTAAQSAASSTVPPPGGRNQLDRTDSVIMPGTPSLGVSRAASESGSSTENSSGSWFSWLPGAAVGNNSQSSTNASGSRCPSVSKVAAAAEHPAAASKLPQTTTMKPAVAEPAAATQSAASKPYAGIKPQLDHADGHVYINIMPGTPHQGNSPASENGSSIENSSSSWFSWLTRAAIGSSGQNSTNDYSSSSSSKCTSLSKPAAAATWYPPLQAATSKTSFTASVEPSAACQWKEATMPPESQLLAGRLAAHGPAVAAISQLPWDRPKLEHVDSVVTPGTPSQGTSRAPSDSGSSNVRDTTSSSSWYNDNWSSPSAFDNVLSLSTGGCGNHPMAARSNSAHSTGTGFMDGLSSWFMSAGNLLTTGVS